MVDLKDLAADYLQMEARTQQRAYREANKEKVARVQPEKPGKEKSPCRGCNHRQGQTTIKPPLV